MITVQQNNIQNTINELYNDAKNDRLKIMKGFAKSVFRSIKPSDFKEVYLSISKEQGEDLQRLIINNNLKNIVEFGTSFGISTLFLAKGIFKTGGNIITTELLESKAKKAQENFKKAGVQDVIEVRIGDAIETLKNYKNPIDLLMLDGWKDLYLPLFTMLEPNFHNNTIIYVDNANMASDFVNIMSNNPYYKLQSQYNGRVVLITKK